MNPDALFTRAMALLPGAVRERLDGDFPIDWAVLEDAATGTELGEAVRVRHRLPEPVEQLVHRLIGDVGIVPADLAAGVERQGTASAWIHWVTLEADGESYQLRNDRTGDVHTGIRPETVAGYATLGMELATAVHETAERWLEAGDHHRAAAEDERSGLAQCAVRMHAHLQAQPDAISGHRTAASLARTFEFAWNTQSVEVRAALSGIRLSTARGACAPRRSHFAPVTGYRLHACDAGEIRWLRALAERAGAGSGASARADGPEEGSHGADAAGRAGTAHAGATEPHSGLEQLAAATLELGSDPQGLMPDAEVAELARAVQHVPDAVRRRMGEAHGATVAQVLERFRGPRAADALRSALGQAESGRSAPAPRWLQGLAAALLMDTGAQNREGLRTASMRLDPQRRPDGGYRGTEIGTGAAGHLTPAALVEQVRLSLVYARVAWAGLTALRNAGKEGEWALNETQASGSDLSASNREMLEAARDIGRALERVRRSHAGAHGQRPPTALEQAAMAAEALAKVGPTVRTAAGWPGAAQAPNARDPEDVARIAAVAESLHGDIRTVANRLIAGWVAEVPPYGENQNA